MWYARSPIAVGGVCPATAVAGVLAPQCPWFAMRPQSPMAQSATRTNEMWAISYESQASRLTP